MDPKHTAFENCLRYVLEGASIEEALARYPVWAEELRPLLETALAAQRVDREIHVPRGAQLRSRALLLRAAAEKSQPRRRSRLYAPLRWSFAALMVILALVFGGFTTAAIAAQALPGEPLYAIKIMTERARLQMADDPAQQLRLEQSFDRERFEEVDALIGQGRSTKVKFIGGLAHKGSDIWTVNGISVQITPLTEIEGEIEEGFHIGVEGVLQPDGRVVAVRVWDRRFEVRGLAQVISRSYWVIDNVRVAIGEDTVFSGAYGPGSRVVVSAGKLLSGQLMARSIKILSVPGVVLSGTDTAIPTKPFLPTETQDFNPTTEPQERATAVEQEDGSAVEATEPAEAEEEEAETPEADKDEGEQRETPEPTEDDGDDGEEGESPEPTEEDDGEERESPDPTEDEGGEDESPEPTEDESPEPTESKEDDHGGNDDEHAEPAGTP